MAYKLLSQSRKLNKRAGGGGWGVLIRAGRVDFFSKKDKWGGGTLIRPESTGIAVLKEVSVLVRHETLCNNCRFGGLKNVNTSSKIIALQYSSWLRRLYDKSFHELNWKIIRQFI